ncbi:MAG: acetyl-CoA carboxylase biotin carboxyl carrier protein subunit [Balneolaceae bacterium]|nr:acetyl-CoA carboxylase biotin carboxyl carrier protein subunit [Balneolaceae bacterium]
MKFEADIEGRTHKLDFDFDQQQVTVGDRSYQFTFEIKNERHLLRVGTRLFKIDNVQQQKDVLEFTINGRWCSVTVHDEQDLLLDRMGFKRAAEIGEGQLNAPMPGKILELIVEEGSEVELGDPVAILEAMKMENELKAPTKGVVTSIAVQAGESVEKNALILEIEASG